MHTITMTPSEWAAVPGNPRQRNTEERLKHIEPFLATPLEVHFTVEMAVLPDGSRFKLNGHTRDLFWQTRPELAPGVVNINVYEAKNIDDVLMLYDTFDSTVSLETAPDKIFGSLREKEFCPVSDFIRRGTRLGSAMLYAYAIECHISTGGGRGRGVRALTEWYLPEIEALDQLNLTSSFFSAPVLCAALLTLRRYGSRRANYTGSREARYPRVVTFWDLYNRDGGLKTETQADAIEALHRVMRAYL